MAWHIGRYFCDYIQFQTRQTTELKLFWQLNRLQNGMIALRMLCRCEERSNIHTYSTNMSTPPIHTPPPIHSDTWI